MKKGSHQTEEAKKRISEKISKIRKEYNPMTGRTGELHHNFGKHWPDEVRKKMSDSHKGKPSTFKGKHHTEEAKRKNSEAHKGKSTWNKGLKTGPHTKEHNKHITDSSSKHPSGRGEWYIRLDGTSIWLRSSYEIRVASVLDSMNVEWKYESRSFEIENRFYRPDFLINNKIWWEVKGYMTEDNKYKLRKFSEIYPEEYIRVIFIDDIVKLENESIIHSVSESELYNIGKELNKIL